MYWLNCDSCCHFQADVVLVMTCSIRDGAEQKIWKKLKHLKMLKSRKPFKKKGPEMKIGILGKLIIVKNVYSVFSPCQLNLYLSFLEAI